MQQLFRLLIFLNQPNMFQKTNSPILRSTFWLYIHSFWYNAPKLLPIGATVEMELHEFHFNRGTKSCIYSQNVLMRMGEFVARNMLSWFKKINKRKSCCILLVVYIGVLIMNGHTNIKLITSCWILERKMSSKQNISSGQWISCCHGIFSEEDVVALCLEFS